MRSSKVIHSLLAAASLSAAAPLLLPPEDPTFIQSPAPRTSGTVIQSLPTASAPATLVSFVDNSRAPSRPVSTISAFQSLMATDNAITETTTVRSIPSDTPTVNSIPSLAPSQPPTTFTNSLAPPDVATVSAPSANPATFITSVAAPRISTQARSGVPNAVSTAAY